MSATIALTPELAWCSGHDAANRAMRKAGRKRWSRDDFNLAVRTQARWMVLGGFWSRAFYTQHMGEPFPEVPHA